MSKARKYRTATLPQIVERCNRGMNLVQIADELELSLSGLRQVASLLAELQPERKRAKRVRRPRVKSIAHNPFGITQ